MTALRSSAIFASVLIAAHGCAVCEQAHADETAPSRVDGFVSAYSCMVIEHLKAIHERGDRSKPGNRYLIVSMPNSLQKFVQCIFFDEDGKLLCEASSGRYGPPAGDKFHFEIDADADAALRQLQFEPPKGRANYQQQIAIHGTDDFSAVARMLLSALFYGYGARIGTALRMKAPTVPSGEVTLASCKPVS